MLPFWTFVSQPFNVLESKRIFPVIAAGSSIGYILAGVTTTVVAVDATEPLIFVLAFGSIAAAIISPSLDRVLFRPAFVVDPDEVFADQDAALHKHGAAPVLSTAHCLVIVHNGLQTGLDEPVVNVLGNALPAQVGPKLKLLLDNGVLHGAAV